MGWRCWAWAPWCFCKDAAGREPQTRDSDEELSALPDGADLGLGCGNPQAIAALSKVARRARKRRAAELLATVGMTDRADAKIGTYSRGMVQRIGVAQALMHDPELVLLDEPTAGLDPVGRRDIREVLTQLRREGRTVFLNSHLLSEVEMVCDRVAILKGREVIRQGSLAELTRPRRLFEIELAGGDLSAARDAVAAALTTGGAAPAGGEPVLDGKNNGDRLAL